MSAVRWAAVLAVLAGALAPAGRSQDRIRSLGVKWLRVGNLHSTFAIEGAEFEMHRTGNLPEQCDGLRWPAQFLYQDCWAAKSMWIGTTNFNDPVAGYSFPYKVVSVGPRQVYPKTEIMPVDFRMIGRFTSPEVTVDGLIATNMALNDVVDEVDPDLAADRMIVHVLHTSIGITVTRKMMAFSHQDNDNYFIYSITLKNTGIIDLNGNTITGTRTGVILGLGYRYAIANEGFKKTWAVAGAASWGRNTVNETVGADPTAGDFEFRAQYAWYGPMAASAAQGFDDWGMPDWRVSGTLGAARMAGVATLHCDTSPSNPSDDATQPRSTQFIGSDTGPVSINQYDANLMAQKYVDFMAAGHPPATHAQLVGDNFGDSYGTDAGGYSHTQGFGPWDLAPGDSVTVILAEAVGGLSREKNLEVGSNWFRHWKGQTSDPMVLPDGGSTTNFDAYKKAWVLTAKDSLFKAFRSAISNYQNGFSLPKPPPPPKTFSVMSGGDRIQLSWADNADSWPTFDGYAVYRAIGKPDTFYQKIYECGKSDAVHEFADTTPTRGFDYFYYIVTKSDGSDNNGVPLVSSKFYTMTSTKARLLRPAAALLDGIRVIPNPYHIGASRLQFGEEQADQISFYGLPAKCTIRIFTERGDLIRTLTHTNTSGDEDWDCTTDFKQVVVSGLYIAHFDVTEDYTDQFGRTAKKGDSAFKKFIIIR
jgi:hypothetical protein